MSISIGAIGTGDDTAVAPRRPRRDRVGHLKVGALVLGAAVLVGYPLINLLRSVLGGSSGPAGAWRAVVTRPVAVALLHTIAVSGAATVIAAVLGVAMALLVGRSDVPFRRLFACAWVAPLVIPAYVTGLAWLDAYTRAGLTDELTHLSVNWLSGAGGVVLLLGLQGAPLAYLIVLAALGSRSTGELEDAARSAGRVPRHVLWDVTLPLLRPAIIAAMLLVFVSSASDFGIPAVLAIPAGFSTVTTLIYSDLSFAGDANAIASASSLSALLGVLALILVVATGRTARIRSGTSRTGGPSSSTRPLIALGRLRPAVALLCGLFLFVTTAVPLVALFVTSVSPAFRLTPWPGHWVANAYAAALSGENIAALGRSVLLSGGAAAIVAVGGACIALLLRRNGRLASASATLLGLPFALPGSVVAIAVLIAWQRWLYGSLLIILLAYVARFAVIGVRTSAATLGGLSDELIEAARVSGATARRAALDVVRPALMPGVVTSFVLVFLFGIHELTMSSLLYGPGTKTFAVEVLAAEEAGELALTAALAVLVTAITALVAAAVLLARSSRRIVAAEAGIEVPAWQR